MGKKVSVDKKVALLGATLGVALSIYLVLDGRSAIFITTSVLATLAFGLYLLFRGLPIGAVQHTASRRIMLLLDTGFWVLFIAALSSYISRTDTYIRPLSFFILTSLAVGVLAVAISLSGLKGKRLYISLCQIMAIGLLLEWTVTLMYPTIVGLDPWWHRWYTLKIIADGGIGMIQQRLPVFHFVVAGTMLSTGLDYRLAAMVSVSLVQVIADVLLVYRLASMAFDRRVALMSALLMTISGWHIWFGYWTTPNTLGATLALAVIYFMARWHKNRRVWELVVVFVVFGLLLLTHPIATIWAVMGVGLYFLVVIIYEWLHDKKLYIPIGLVIPIVILVGVMSLWWGVDSGYWRTISTFVQGSLLPAQAGYSYTPVPSTVVISPPLPSLPLYDETWLAGSYWESLFNSSGMFLYFALSIFGCLYIMRGWRGNMVGIFLVIFGFIILSIGYFPMLFGMSVIEHRWWYFAQILMAVPLGVVLLRVSQAGKVGLVLLSLLVVASAFLMSVGLPTNMDNLTFSKNQLVRYALTEPEVRALYDVVPQYGEKVALDSFYAVAAVCIFGYDIDKSGVQVLTPALLSGDFTSYDVVLIRDGIVKRPFAHGNGVIYRLNYDPRPVLIKQGFVRIYDNGSVSAFERQK